jgi:DNA-binding NtrC family response regulator
MPPCVKESEIKKGGEGNMKKRILVIDDDWPIRELFLSTLTDVGYQVDTAESAEKGIEAAQQTNYDLVYLNLNWMQAMDGVETLRALRKIDRDVPVYIVTAFNGELFSQLESAEKDGIEFKLLQKPVGTDQLIDVTKGILEGPVELIKERYNRARMPAYGP